MGHGKWRSGVIHCFTFTLDKFGVLHKYEDGVLNAEPIPQCC